MHAALIREDDDVSDKPIDWRREYGDLLAELERVRASWKCPEKWCHNGLVPDFDPPGPIRNLKPCPNCKRADEHVEHGRRVLGM
jgi:hypothetical protein